MIRVLFASIAALALLASCGGGGGGSAATAVTAASAEGLWVGKASTGYDVNALVLENGEVWGLYSSGTTIYGALTGSLATTGNSISGSGSDFNILSRTVTNATFTGSANTKNSISITASTGAAFSGAYSNLYDQAPASFATLAGTFVGSGVTGNAPVQSTSVTVSSGGVISAGSVALGCTAAGQVTARPSGKNVYNITLKFTGASCALGNGVTVTGVAAYNTTTRQLVAMGLNPAKTDGFIYTGNK